MASAKLDKSKTRWSHGWPAVTLASQPLIIPASIEHPPRRARTCRAPQRHDGKGRSLGPARREIGRASCRERGPTAVVGGGGKREEGRGTGRAKHDARVERTR